MRSLIDTTAARVIASADTKQPDRQRWTELRVVLLPEAARKRWVAEVIGHSTIEGERTRRRQGVAATLERALTFFDTLTQNGLGLVVAQVVFDAREWAADNAVRID